jgi:hypothetical protein
MEMSTCDLSFTQTTMPAAHPEYITTIKTDEVDFGAI